MIVHADQETAQRRVQIAVLAAGIVALAAVLGTRASPAASSIVHGDRMAGVLAPSIVSSNWSGYAVVSSTDTDVSYSSITGTWTAPTVRCISGETGRSSSIWVGLGGYSKTSQALEQIGTEADCDESGKPAYSAWYELVPDDPVTLGPKIVPGDTITTSVSIVGATSVLLRITNGTRDWTVTRKLSFAHPDTSSAEWIVEAPCTGSVRDCSELPLANFGIVRIRKAAAVGDGVSGTLANPAWTVKPLELVPHASRHAHYRRVQPFRSFVGSTAGAWPGTISADGTAFGVAWSANAATLTSH